MEMFGLDWFERMEKAHGHVRPNDIHTSTPSLMRIEL
jgi:hypothetical protein